MPTADVNRSDTSISSSSKSSNTIGSCSGDGSLAKDVIRVPDSNSKSLARHIKSYPVKIIGLRTVTLVGHTGVSSTNYDQDHGGGYITTLPLIQSLQEPVLCVR
jgi:hypothetical protein